jgi:hypothetical protein
MRGQVSGTTRTGLEAEAEMNLKTAAAAAIVPAALLPRGLRTSRHKPVD